MSRLKSLLLCLTIALGCLARAPALASGTYFRVDARTLGQQTGLEKGQYRLGVRADFQEYSKVRLPSGNYENVRDVGLRTYSIFGEYALTSSSIVYGVLPFVDNDAALARLQFSPTAGLGDVRLGYSQAAPIRGSASFLGTAELSFAPVPYDTTKMTAPGDNSTELSLQGFYQDAALFNSPLYLSAGGGVRLRAGDSPNQWVWSAEIGRQIGRAAAASVFIDEIHSMSGLSLTSPEFLGDFAVLKQTVTRVGARVNLKARGLDAQLYFARAIRFQNQAPSNFFGLVVSRPF